MPRAVIVLHSPLSPNSALETLRNNVDEERRALFSWSGYEGELPMLGRIQSDSIRIRKRIFYHNGFARQFYGRLIAESGGTRIEGYFAGSMFTKCFLALWWGFYAWSAGSFAITAVRRLATGSGYEIDKTGILILTAMGAGTFLIIAVGRLLSRPGEKFILEELREILAVADNTELSDR